MVELQKKTNLDNQGIGLIETILAVFFSIFLIIALVTLTNFNIRNSTLVGENQRAINSANKLVEEIRVVKDVNFAAFVAKVSADCVNTNCDVDPSAVTIIPATIDLNSISPYSYFRAEKISNDEVKINVTTEWKIGTQTYSSPLSTIFTNWRAKN